MRNKLKNFISSLEKKEIIGFIERLSINSKIDNIHINHVASKLNGDSFMFDITKTEKSNKLSSYQSSNNLMEVELPEIFINILDRISKELNISKENVFLQILNQEVGGYIYPHYDSSIDGYITYKCNICVLGDDYQLFVDNEIIDIEEKDLYTFEASLYKHWTEPFKNKRVIISYGFILPYQDLGRNEQDPRVRLSKKILKYFQNPLD
jgi:hypothetical protein